MHIAQTHPELLVEDCRKALQEIRRSLIELYASVGADPNAPQEVSRKFGIHRNLTWKVSRVMSAGDPFATLQHLPGDSGLEIAIEAFRKAGAPTEVLKGVQQALRGFDEVVKLHAGERAHLELMLDSAGLLGTSSALERSRELAFEGLSGLWGVQAKCKLTTGFVAPSASKPDHVDCVLVGGYGGFRRLRTQATWTLFRFSGYNDDGTPRGYTPGSTAEIEPQEPGQPPRILRRFCSPNMPSLSVTTHEGIADYVLPSGPVGNLGAFDCYFGHILAGLPYFKRPGDERAAFASAITLPTELLVLDAIVHKSLPTPNIEMVTFGFPNGSPENPHSHRHRCTLPIVEPIVELAGNPPAVAHTTVPKYGEVVNAVYERMGWKPSDFRGMRVTMRHPPMSTLIELRWSLPG
ncbi:MAG TPA: hypothetical protein VHN77_10925 [Phycisphaerales bacterium]|nr:hypothetical protein [Phycisphaerales bacterium]